MREKLLNKTTIGIITVEFFSEPGDHYLIVVSTPKEYSSQVYSDRTLAEEVNDAVISAVSDGADWADICGLLIRRP